MLVACLVGAPAQAIADDPADLPRVAAVGLCADHYVLALADPAQIVSLSDQATGPLSPHRDRAAAYPANRGSVEDLLMLDADVAVVDAGTADATTTLMERFGIRVVTVGDGFRARDTLAALRRVGNAIGRAEVAETLARALDDRLADGTPGAQTGAMAAYFRPGGGSAGQGTVVDDVLTAAGLRNLKAELGESGWGRLDLEALVLTPPDLIVTSFFDTVSDGLVGNFNRHPVFGRFTRDLPVLAVPGAYWPCASPHLIDAIDLLRVQVPALVAEDDG